MRIETYLRFNGTCRQAFEFYRSCFGGDFTAMLQYRDGPGGMGVSGPALDKVMHAALPVGESVLMGSDAMAGFGPPTEIGNNFSVFVQAGSRAEADRVFAALSAGGEVTVPQQDMFWGGYFGSLVDQFGISWQVQHAAAP